MKRVKRASRFFSFLFLLVLLLIKIPLSMPQEELPSGKKDLEFLEHKLFELTNRERQKRGLPRVWFSRDLSQLAREHSHDMATNGRISHASSDGRSYMERLVAAKFYFIAIGENVAFSNKFEPELIHEGLMDSSGHRENILDPAFDQVGIGAVLYEDKGYYVTQDFRRAPVLRDARQVEREIKRDINELRRRSRLPSLYSSFDADKYALQCSKNMIEKKPPPPMPNQFRAVQYHFITSPALEGIQSIYADKVIEVRFNAVGLGVTFARNTQYPGGCYFIALLLFPGI
jgi:uncharacterized protein YkwD